MPADQTDTGSDAEPRWLNLKQVARELDVHYMTVYRYVRKGRLQAGRDGTEWRVSTEALAEFRRAAAMTRPTGGGRASSAATDIDGAERWADRLVAPLERGDEPAAMRVLEEALGSGHDLAFCFLDVIAPAMTTIDRQAEQDATTAPAALATMVAQRLVARLGSRFRRPGRTRGTVILGAPTGEHHQLALSMIADLLRNEGYGVLELGTDAAPEAFAETAQRAERLAAVGIGITTADRLEEALATVTALRTVVPTVPIMVGGQAVLNDDMARLLGADGWAADGRQAVRVLERLASSRVARSDRVAAERAETTDPGAERR